MLDVDEKKDEAYSFDFVLDISFICYCFSYSFLYAVGCAGSLHECWKPTQTSEVYAECPKPTRMLEVYAECLKSTPNAGSLYEVAL